MHAYVVEESVFFHFMVSSKLSLAFRALLLVWLVMAFATPGVRAAGDAPAPADKIKEMYHPDRFAETAADRVSSAPLE